MVGYVAVAGVALSPFSRGTKCYATVLRVATATQVLQKCYSATGQLKILCYLGNLPSLDIKQPKTSLLQGNYRRKTEGTPTMGCSTFKICLKKRLKGPHSA